MFSLICAWTDGWVNNQYTSYLRRHRTHYNISIMLKVYILTPKMMWLKCLCWVGKHVYNKSNDSIDAGNLQVTGGFPAQRASDAESMSMTWGLHASPCSPWLFSWYHRPSPSTSTFWPSLSPSFLSYLSSLCVVITTGVYQLSSVVSGSSNVLSSRKGVVVGSAVVVVMGAVVDFSSILVSTGSQLTLRWPSAVK